MSVKNAKFNSLNHKNPDVKLFLTDLLLKCTEQSSIQLIQNNLFKQFEAFNEEECRCNTIFE